MPKECSINPAAAQRKADKQKEIARSKKQQQAQRNERLGRRNPERLQRQIDELKALEASGTLRQKDKETLAQLERDLKGVRRAREQLGIQDEPRQGREHDARLQQQERRPHLGKRRRDYGEADSGSDTDPEVRGIPMPRDTPPPIPRPSYAEPQVGPDGRRIPHALPAKPTAPETKTVYSAAPQIRNLKKEAVRFMPSVVAQQRNRIKGQGRLLEPNEVDRLEKSGYYAAQKATEGVTLEARLKQKTSEVRSETIDEKDLEEELRRFEAEMKDVYLTGAEEPNTDGLRRTTVEEVDDEGD